MPNKGDRISEYLLDVPIGRGAFGEVWRARHHAWKDQFVAIKFPSDPQFVRQLQREGLAAAGLDHPNIVRALGFDPFADPPYLVMQYVAGESLRAAMRRGCGIDDCIAIVRQILVALDYAHRRGVIHRDLKPENVLLPSDPPDPTARIVALKLADFASPRPRTTSEGSILFSRSIDSPDAVQIVGTLDYMSPEQRSGDAVDARTDLFALGVILHELLTGERPAGAELPSALNPAVPAWVDDLFRRAYARLDRRFDSASSMLRFIDERRGAGRAIPTAPHLPVSSTPVPQLCRQCRRHVAVDDQFCMHCGVQLAREIRRCQRCAAYPDAHDAFCGYCGQALTPTSPAQRIAGRA